MNKEIVIFKTDDEAINVEVRFEDETAWLTQDQMSVLFSKSKSTINEHIKNVFKEGELDEKVVVRKFRITTPHGAIEGKNWQELLARIRDIRASEKVFYRQVLDIYATSIDYDPKADTFSRAGCRTGN